MAWRKTYDGAEPQRVNKWLASEGVCSRREAEELIAKGAIAIDGARVDEPGRKVLPGQTIEVGETRSRPKISIAINKPVGVVSAQPEGAQIPAVRLLTRANLIGPPRNMPSKRTSLAPLGRLDQDKEYLVAVRGEIDQRKLALLRHGLRLDGRDLKPARVELVQPQCLRLVLTEGRNRQIRRMCELVELEVSDLLRIRIGPLKLGDLPEGKWRAVTPEERETMIRESKA